MIEHINIKIPHLLQNYTNHNILYIPKNIKLKLNLHINKYIECNNNIYYSYINDEQELIYKNTNTNDYYFKINNFKLKYNSYDNSYIKYNEIKLNINDEIDKNINLVKDFCYMYKFIKYNLINNFNYNHGDKHFNKCNKKNNNNSISSNYMKCEMDNNVNFIIMIQNKIENYLKENKLPNEFIEVFKENKNKRDKLLTCILFLFYILEIINKLYNYISYGIETIKNIKLNPDVINISNTIFNNIPNDLLIYNNDIIKIKDKNCGIIYNDSIQVCDYIILKLINNKWNLHFNNIKNTNINNNISINDLNKNYNNNNNDNYKQLIKNKQNELIELIHKHINEKNILLHFLEFIKYIIIYIIWQYLILKF